MVAKIVLVLIVGVKVLVVGVLVVLLVIVHQNILPSCSNVKRIQWGYSQDTLGTVGWLWQSRREEGWEVVDE